MLIYTRPNSRFTKKKASMLTDGNLDGAERRTTLLRGEPVPVAPRILIVENQSAIQDLLCWTLQQAGYHTTVCAGRQALLTWREQAMPGDDPALVLLDLSLLCTTQAADFLCHLRARWRNACDVLLQVIVLTTSTQVQAEQGTRERVLQKPFHVGELLALIRQVILVVSRSEASSSREACAPAREEEDSLSLQEMVW
jgi:DNA-binding response OmpR family regulator